jgi:RimJ/RimL family protein N-acetyltransferase
MATKPDAPDARAFLVEDALRDASPVTFRAARPDDGPRIVRAFRGLERESVYTRFFSYRGEPTPRELAHLADIDFVNEVMLVATVARDGEEVVVGGGRYVAAGEGAVRSAEVAFTVEEDYQGQGIASRLLRHLAAIARSHGFVRLEAFVLPANRPMLAVFERSGLAMTQRRDDGAVHVVLSL